MRRKLLLLGLVLVAASASPQAARKSYPPPPVGIVSPAQLTADQNDYAGCTAGYPICRLNVDATTREITGIAGGTEGRVLNLVNTTTTAHVMLIDESWSTASAAANRLLLGRRNCTIGPGNSVQLVYDSTSSRWRMIDSDGCGQNEFGRYLLETYNPCYSAAAGTEDHVWAQVASGTGSSMSTSLALSMGSPCYMVWIVGTTTSGRVSATTALGSHTFGGGYYTAEGVLITGSALSNGTDTYYYRFGAIDSVTAESTDGCFIRYTHSLNSGKFEGVCRNNSTESVCDTGVTVATTTQYVMAVRVNSAGTLATFNVNQVGSCTISTNIPVTTARAFGHGASLLKTAGTTTVGWYAGPMQFRMDLKLPFVTY